MSLYVKRNPYPYHVNIGGRGFMLGSQGKNQPMLVSQKSQDIAQVAPPDYSYGGANPVGDRQEPYEALTLGMGLALQENWEDRRYLSSRAVDLSVWPWLKGPEIVMFSPPARDSVAGVAKFFELGGVLYCAQGRYILRRVSDAQWNVVKDFGAGMACLDVAVFTRNADDIERAFVALDNGLAHYSIDGTTWTPMATFHALAFAVTGREFWWADNVNRLRKLDTNSDPTNEANYTSLIFDIGDGTSPITALMVSAGGTLVVSKTDGLYTLDAAGDDHELFPFLRFAPHPNNGKAWGQYENNLYVAFNHSFGRVSNALDWTPVGPEKLINNTSGVSGKISAFAGVETMFALAGIYNGETGTGYLLKFGAWVSRDQGQQQQDSGDAQHIDSWHGSLSEPLVGRAIQTIFISAIGAPAGHTRAYLGMSDGSIGYLLNPCSPNPASCTDYRYHVGDGWVDLPVWTGTFPATVKSLRYFSVTGPLLDATRYVTLEYRVDEATIWTPLDNRFDSQVFETYPFPPTSEGTLVGFRVHLHNAAATSSPQVAAVSIGHAVRPKRVMQFSCDILCADGIVRRDGVVMRMGRKDIRRWIEQAVDNPGAILCVLPDESTVYLSFTDFEVRQSFDEVGRQWRGSLRIKAVEWQATPSVA